MPVPTPQIGILGVRRSPTRFHQGCFQPRIAAPRATASRLASAFPVARAHRCPRCQMRRSRKLAHIGANLSDDHLGRPAVHPRDALQLSHLLDKRGAQFLNLGVQPGNSLVQMAYLPELFLQQPTMVVADYASKRLLQRNNLARNRPRASSASFLASLSPAASLSSIDRPLTPSTSVATLANLMLQLSSNF